MSKFTKFLLASLPALALLPFLSALPASLSQQTVLQSLSMDITIGDTNLETGTDSGNGNLLLAQQATLSQQAVLHSLSMDIITAAGSLRLGVYDATGPNGGPGALEAQTNAFTPTTGWNTQPVISQVTLNPGTYWLAYLPSSSSLSFPITTTSGPCWYQSFTFAALPSTFSTSPTTCAPTTWSLYATLAPTGVQPPTATLMANPTSITVGQSSTLTWSSTVATSCTGVGFSTGNATSGSVTVTPAGSTAYSVTCTNSAGSGSASATVVVNGGTSTTQVPGPSQALFTSPPYTCTTNYYVSPTGSSSNSGTQTSPWDIDTAFSHTASAGTCFNLADGTYTPSATLSLSYSGSSATPSGYVVYRAYQTMDGPHIMGTNVGANLMDVTGAYVWIDGLNIDGNDTGGNGARENCVNQFVGGSPGDGTSSHHLWVTNSILHNCGQAGFQGGQTDYEFFVHNTVYHNSYDPAYVLASGTTIYEPLSLTGYTRTTCTTGCTGNAAMAYDNYWCASGSGISALNVCYDLVYTYNWVYDNYNPQTGGGSNTDGEGFEADDWSHEQYSCSGIAAGKCPYSGNALLMGNVFDFNGSAGIETNGTSNVGTLAIINNTAYDNGWDPYNTGNPSNRGDFMAYGAYNDSNHQYWINNVASAVQASCSGKNGQASGCQNFAFVAFGGGTGSVWQNNVGYPAGQDFQNNTFSFPPSGTNKNLDGSNPLFTSVSPGTPPTTLGNHNFALQGNSPAISFGQPFSLWQQASVPNAGACVSGLPSCP